MGAMSAAMPMDVVRAPQSSQWWVRVDTGSQLLSCDEEALSWQRAGPGYGLRLSW